MFTNAENQPHGQVSAWGISRRIRSRITRRGADAHPCALLLPVLLAKASVIPAGLAGGGGWARLTQAVRQTRSLFG